MGGKNQAKNIPFLFILINISLSWESKYLKDSKTINYENNNNNDNNNSIIIIKGIKIRKQIIRSKVMP